jgi:hypothetical protein
MIQIGGFLTAQLVNHCVGSALPVALYGLSMSVVITWEIPADDAAAWPALICRIQSLHRVRFPVARCGLIKQRPKGAVKKSGEYPAPWGEGAYWLIVGVLVSQPERCASGTGCRAQLCTDCSAMGYRGDNRPHSGTQQIDTLALRQQHRPGIAGTLCERCPKRSSMIWKVMSMKGNTTWIILLVVALTLSGCARAAPERDAAAHAAEAAQNAANAASQAAAAHPKKTSIEEARTSRSGTSKNPQSDDIPPIPANELRRRILTLLGSLDGREKFEKSRVEAIMQAKLSYDQEWKQSAYGGRVEEGWRYGVTYSQPLPLYPTDLPEIKIWMSAAQDGSDDSVTLCTFDLEKFAQEVAALGYKPSSNWQRPRSDVLYKTSLALSKRSSDRKIVIAVHLYPYPLDLGPDGQQVCVREIRILAGETADG